jgi:hypothetical protein
MVMQLVHTGRWSWEGVLMGTAAQSDDQHLHDESEEPAGILKAK